MLNSVYNGSKNALNVNVVNSPLPTSIGFSDVINASDVITSYTYETVTVWADSVTRVKDVTYFSSSLTKTFKESYAYNVTTWVLETITREEII